MRLLNGRSHSPTTPTAARWLRALRVPLRNQAGVMTCRLDPMDTQATRVPVVTGLAPFALGAWCLLVW
jgi:hypothetical protein